MNHDNGEKLKQFFIKMSIQPFQSIESILEKIHRRKEMIEKIKNHISKRENLTESQKKIITERNEREKEGGGDLIFF